MRVNVSSVFLVTKAALPLLLAARGSIVNIGSVAGSVGVRQRFAYCASKGAVQAMTRQIAVDYPKELRINCIAPGTVQTPFVEGYLEKYHSHEKEKVRAELVARQPIGRLGTPEDIASLVRFLARKRRSLSTAQFCQSTADGQRHSPSFDSLIHFGRREYPTSLERYPYYRCSRHRSTLSYVARTHLVRTLLTKILTIRLPTASWRRTPVWKDMG